MIFIVDTNIVFAGLLKDSVTREILIDSPFILYAPETMVKEIRKHENLIIQKSGLSEEEFEALFNLLTDSIQILERHVYSESMEEAEKIIGHIDKGDAPFLALALSVPNNGIWTENIRHFGKQDKVKIWTTKDIIEMLGKI